MFSVVLINARQLDRKLRYFSFYVEQKSEKEGKIKSSN